MTADRVQPILDSAKYLRNVRPIDPAELVHYVEGDISVESVNSILREHLVELELIERPDGTFTPPDSSPVDVPFSRISRLPARYERTVTTRLEAAYGPEWDAGQSGDELRDAIRSFKRAYFAGEPVTYDRPTALGYAIYHLPATFATVQYVIAQLGAAGRLDHAMRILDVGAGVGGGGIAIDAYLPDNALVEYTALEPSTSAVAVMERLLAETGRNFHWRTDVSTIEDAELVNGSFDLILLANVVSELRHPRTVIPGLVDALAPDGSMVVIAPADERTSRQLRRVETATVRQRPDLDVFAPALRLWPDRQPVDHCWSFDVKPDLDVPSFQRSLDEGRRAERDDRDPASGEFGNVDLQFSYSILRRDGIRRIAFTPTRDAYLPLRASDERVTDRVSVAVVKLSHSLATADDSNPLFVIGDGSQRVEHFATVADETHRNRQVLAAEYGDVLLVHGGLLLWNPDEGAFNVVVDSETTVDRIGPDGVHPA